MNLSAFSIFFHTSQDFIYGTHFTLDSEQVPLYFLSSSNYVKPIKASKEVVLATLTTLSDHKSNYTFGTGIAFCPFIQR